MTIPVRLMFSVMIQLVSMLFVFSKAKAVCNVSSKAEDISN